VITTSNRHSSSFFKGQWKYYKYLYHDLEKQIAERLTNEGFVKENDEDVKAFKTLSRLKERAKCG